MNVLLIGRFKTKKIQTFRDFCPFISESPLLDARLQSRLFTDEGTEVLKRLDFLVLKLPINNFN